MNEKTSSSTGVSNKGIYVVKGLLVDACGLSIYDKTADALIDIAYEAFKENNPSAKINDGFGKDAEEEINLIAMLAVHQIVQLIKKYGNNNAQKQEI